MPFTQFSSTTAMTPTLYSSLSSINPTVPHIHQVDMPFRVTSTWQDRDCQIGVWTRNHERIAYALFQPPWGVVDFSISPGAQDSAMEREVFAWGKEQIIAYARRTGENFEGVFEFYQDHPDAARMAENLQLLGFIQQDWSVIRFSLDLNQDFPQPQVPEGYRLRSFRGEQEAEAYVTLVDAVFGPHWLTKAWRLRSLAHPDYLSAIDLVVEQIGTGLLVGYCHCWLREGVGQIEPLGVHPDHHRLGLGTAMELAAISVLKQHGAHTLLVDHGSTNTKAIALSERTGFRPINTAIRYAVQTKNY